MYVCRLGWESSPAFAVIKLMNVTAPSSAQWGNALKTVKIFLSSCVDYKIMYIHMYIFIRPHSYAKICNCHASLRSTCVQQV